MLTCCIIPLDGGVWWLLATAFKEDVIYPVSDVGEASSREPN